MLGAVYGQTSGDGLKNLAALRRRFPRAVAYVDDAAQAGRGGPARTDLAGPYLPAARPATDATDEAGIPQGGRGADRRGGGRDRRVDPGLRLHQRPGPRPLHP